MGMIGLEYWSLEPKDLRTGGNGYDEGYGLNVECVAQSDFQKVVDCQSRLWNMRGGPRHSGDLGDEYTYPVAFFDITDVNRGFITFPHFHAARWSARRYR